MKAWRLLLATLGLAAGLGGALAQPHPPTEPRGLPDMRLHDFAAKWMVQQDDLAELAYYREANQQLAATAATDTRPRIVLLGDSITFHWPAEALPAAPAQHTLNRGIPGQNSTQLLLRFEDDVVALQPAAVVLLAGTNDLRVYLGEPAAAADSVLARLRRNITAMADIAQARGIQLVLCTLPPLGADSARLQRDPATLRRANTWLRQFAAARGYALADYHAVLADGAGQLPERLTADGLHPNAEGYRRMLPALEAALAAALAASPARNP
jgi:lysophospholipase L1-like esterase